MDEVENLLFDGLPSRPDARTHDLKAKSSVPVISDEAVADLMRPSSWGIPGIEKRIRGKKMTLYTFGCLANALQRKLVTLRLWEKEGRLPLAPYRAEHVAGPGGRVGRRYYSQRSINNAQLEFYKRGLLSNRRIDWEANEDLTEAIAKHWKQEIDEFIEETGGNK